eukprot:2309359-Rhodomonas_salina.1
MTNCYRFSIGPLETRRFWYFFGSPEIWSPSQEGCPRSSRARPVPRWRPVGEQFAAVSEAPTGSGRASTRKMSARQGVMPKWVERAITRMEEWRKSPLVFVQPSWEESYRRWHFSKLSQWRVWMHIVLFSGLIGLLSNFIELLQISERSHNVSALCRGAVSSIVSIVYFFSMEIMLRAISISAKTQGAWDVQPHLHKSVCLLSIAIACELWLVMESEAKTVELALRWVATCPLAFATFEANGA